jgi:cobalt-zinc-cadmium efflux system outer membrane protein
MRSFSSALALAGVLISSGCAQVPRDRGGADINRALAERGAPAADWEGTRAAALPAEAISLPQAVRLAFVRSPRIQELYAGLGVAAADLQEAAQLPDLALGYTRLSSGGESQVTHSLSLAFSELLLRHSRIRLADAGFAMTRDRVAARLLTLEAEVGAAWFDYVTARQSAALAAVSARAARASAEYARRLHAAGNLPPRALAEELAAQGSADIAAARAQARELQARAAFASLAGLSVRDAWQVPERLPALPAADEVPENLAERAFAARGDLAAARRETDAFALALRAARAWRWLGEFEVGYERETETDGVKLRGPTLRLTLPLFHWNRAGVLRAQAALDGARARRAELELALRNELSLGLDRLATTRRIAAAYRDALVPQRAAVYARTMEEVNFMLAGTFEALAARREQFDAGREYLDAVRDYWLAWLELRRVSGGALPAPATGAPLDIGAHE